ncbi:CHAT domain-containing protein [Triangularia setosa]|uniref:CHAT domain-containing protein n=1 Tax=Triangularia setosa TaxID=2587417 RepID=A0AAN6W2T1_9PEZI|nr:CHAT domain-containing protein [Podospora setosa]
MAHLIEPTKASIRGHRWRGTFAEGHQFITALPQEIRSLTSVAIEAAQLYLVQGQYTLAAKTCEDQQPGSGEEGAVLELLQAFIGIGRYSKLKAALKTAQNMEGAWHLNTQGEEAKLSRQLQSMTIEETDEADALLSESRVLMVHYYWKILVVAAEQGLLDEKQTKAAAVFGLAPVLQQVLSEGRFREARFLIYSKAHLLNDTSQAVEELSSFLRYLTDPEWTIERALTLVDLAGLQLKSNSDAVLAQAAENFKLASNLFTKIGHTFGNIDIDLIRVSADRTISAGEIFLAKTRIADRYFEVQQYQNGIRCLAGAISPDMIVDTYYQDVVRSLELLDRKIGESGSEILKQLSLIHSVCQASLKAPEYGFALKSLESYFRNVPEEISPKYQSYMGVILSTVYSNFGETEKALEVARQALEIAMSSASYIDQSDAATQVGVRMLSLAREQSEGSDEFLGLTSSAVDFLKEWANKDAEHCYADGEAQKCLFIAEWDSNEQPWIERVKKHIPDSADPLMRIPVVDLELRLLMRQGRFSESLALSTRLVEQLQKVTDVSPFKKAQTLLSACIQAFACVQSTFRADQKLTPENTQSAVKLLWATLRVSHNALQLYRQANGVELVVDCTLFVWEVLNLAALTMPDDGHHELLVAFMDEMSQTERLCDKMRQSVVSVAGLQSLMHKRFLVSKKASLKLYSVAVDLALKLDDPANAWLSLQRGKARAFADSLGADCVIPQRLLDQINSDHAAYELLKEEQNILELLQEQNVNHVVAARRLTSLRKNMEGHPLLAEAARLRGQLFNLDLATEELKVALQATGLTADKVKFVDWYVPAMANTSHQKIHLFVRQLDGTTYTKQLPIIVDQVKDWIAKTLVYPDMATPPLARKMGNQLLKRMNALVEGLSDSTSEGDLLILSPSGPLNSVPLHALDVGKEPLIQRNLVVYASSVATLGQCLLRISPTPHADGQAHQTYSTKFFAVYEEPDRFTERDQIFEHIQSLPRSFPGTVALGPQVTKPHFLQECATANWIHYHGHARYSEDDILKSSLVLSDGNDIFNRTFELKDKDGELTGQTDTHLLEPPESRNDYEDNDSGSDCNSDDHTAVGDEGVDELLVSELFEATLPRGGVHFTIIACDSGTQDIAPGDEPLGIIPALLYAGATSVLGCQWPIDSRAGRAFSEAFYEEVASMQTGKTPEASRAVHLASGLRSTVMRMKKGELGAEFKQAYYWAPFVLHGLWYFSRG